MTDIDEVLELTKDMLQSNPSKARVAHNTLRLIEMAKYNHASVEQLHKDIDQHIRTNLDIACMGVVIAHRDGRMVYECAGEKLLGLLAPMELLKDVVKERAE